MLADRLHISGLSRGPGLHLFVRPVHFNRIAWHRLRGARGCRQQFGDIGDLDGPMLTGDAVELLEDLGGTQNGRLLALDLDRVVAGRHANPES